MTNSSSTVFTVLKFGGTSLGTAGRMREVASLIQREERSIVVLSAISGTTNTLQELADRSTYGASVNQQIGALRLHYLEYIEELFDSSARRDQAKAFILANLQQIGDWCQSPKTPLVEKEMLAQGELMSTYLFGLLLEEMAFPASSLPALDVMRLTPDQEPDQDFLASSLQTYLSNQPEVNCWVTQGYICRNAQGAIDNLQRGGSDYTATLMGAAVGAREIQIWTDIDGMHNNDPRVVANTRPVRKVSYREAAELAYFGAKILHPTCVIPAEQRQIPLRLKNTFAPQSPGTLISGEGSGRAVAAVAVKHGITAIRIQSDRMLNAYGFLRRVFSVFERHQTPIDMITTSEVSVSLTIDQVHALPLIIDELKTFGRVDIDTQQSIVCLVGDRIRSYPATLARTFAALEEVPIRMVSYGGSQNNISLLLEQEQADRALRAIHESLFREERRAVLN
jgi:aspartate kinase